MQWDNCFVGSELLHFDLPEREVKSFWKKIFKKKKKEEKIKNKINMSNKELLHSALRRVSTPMGDTSIAPIVSEMSKESPTILGTRQFSKEAINLKLLHGDVVSEPEPEPVYTLADVPIGYNLRGKKIIFTNTELLPAYSQRNTMLTSQDGEGNLDMGFLVVYSSQLLRIVYSYTNYLTEEYADETLFLGVSSPPNYEITSPSWDILEVQLPDDVDLPVVYNNLPRSEEGIWGFEYALISN